MKNITPSSTTNAIAEDQIKRIAENLTQAIDKHERSEDQYDAFKTVIDRIERNCKKVALNSILNRSNVTNSDEIKSVINEFYVKNIRDYSMQLKQTIVDRQMTSAFIYNVANNVRSLCQKMIHLAKSKIRAAKKFNFRDNNFVTV